MISLSFVKPHRSITDLAPVSLPDFTIITGVNGSGKTHLLEAIDNQSIHIAGLPRTNNSVRRFDWNSLIPRTENAVDPVHLVRAREGLISGFVDVLSKISFNIAQEIENLHIPGLPTNDKTLIMRLEESSFRALAGDDNSAAGNWSRIQTTIKNGLAKYLNPLHQNAIYGQLLLYLENVSNVKGQALLSCSAADINRLVPLDWTPVDIFQHNLSEVFAIYHRALEENRFRSYCNEKYSESCPVLSEKDFRALFGEPPWDFLNQTLKEAGLDYRATHPSGRADLPFQVKLTNKATGVDVLFSDLSSGEKIIMSFALCLYHSQTKHLDVGYPKMLLLDEIDAPLHPSMTKGLIAVIENILVRQKKVKVLLTTHSPATVAFAPEGSLYRMERRPRQLVTCEKAEAIQALTSGYISVTENTRFVVTEARRDREIYTQLYKKLTERGQVAVFPNLVFIQASDKKDKTGGGREPVRNWSEKLSLAGLDQIYGLIDGDAGNAPSNHIKVLPRHSIENFLLDPINVYANLMQKRKHCLVIDIGISDCDFHQLKNAKEAELQAIADKICELVEAQLPDLKNNSKGRFEVEYICGKKISLPTWLRDHRGHDLEVHYRKCFQGLIEPSFVITKNDCEDLIAMLTEQLPDFIPCELVGIINEIQR